MSNSELKEILQRIASKDNAAFDDLYKDYSKVIFGIALSLLKNEDSCNDIVQIVMSKLYTMPKENFPTSHELTWLYAVTKNEVLQLLRKERLHIPIDDILDMASEVDDISHAVDMDTYRDMIKYLDDQSKAIVTLKVIAGFSHKDIGKLLHMPTGTVQWKYHVAIHKLRISLSNFVIAIVSIFSGYAYAKIMVGMSGGGKYTLQTIWKFFVSDWIFMLLMVIVIVSLFVAIYFLVTHLKTVKQKH